MKNFQRLAFGLDVGPLLHAVQRQPDLWDQNTLRTQHAGTVHGSVNDIWIRFNDTKPYEQSGEASVVVDGHESIWYPAAARLPQVRTIVFDLARRVEAERIGRVLITRLAPGKRILPHVDGGDHAAYYERYQIALQGLPGSLFRAGDETVQMKSGEVWWFDNGVEHEVVNNSADDRIHLIVDLRVSQC